MLTMIPIKKKQLKDVLYWDILAHARDNVSIANYWDKSDKKVTACEALADAGIKGISAFIERRRNFDKWKYELGSFLENLYYLSKLSSVKVIVGESGTGKESMAKALHSMRFDNINIGEFTTFDAASVHKGSIESELFGHKKGAFTNAVDEREGIIKHAGGGTLFIDELGKVEQDVQAKLLRVIEYKHFRPLGADAETYCGEINFIVSLQPNDITEGKVFPDLKNRLNLYSSINLPTLSERLKRDSVIIYDVMGTLLKREDIQKILKDANMPSEDNRNGDVDVKKILRSSISNLKATVRHGIPAIVIKDIVKGIESNVNYKKVRLNTAIEITKFTFSEKVFRNLSFHYRYEEDNFRGLYSILEHSLLNAIKNRRYTILMKDLPEKVRYYGNKDNEVIYNPTPYSDTRNISLKDILDYGEKIKKEIVREKIKSVYATGKNVKKVLSEEGVPDLEYINYQTKLARLVGPLDKIKKDSKI